MSNYILLNKVIDVVEANLFGDVSLEAVSNKLSYSKYHIHKLFSTTVGIPLNRYIIRRRLTEAANLLVHTEVSLLDISLQCGYQSQQAFTDAFKKIYRMSPQRFRKRNIYFPHLQRYKMEVHDPLGVKNAIDVEIVELESMKLAGYKASTLLGFAAIPICMKKLLKKRKSFSNHDENSEIIALYDYSNFEMSEKQEVFDFYALVEIDDIPETLNGLKTISLDKSLYAVFTFWGNPEKSLKPVSDYIYKEWLPQTSWSLCADKAYEFTKNTEKVDEDGQCIIRYYLPIKS